MARKKIGFVLLSGSQRPLASTRISVLNMLPYLRAAGAYDPEIVFDPTQHSEMPDVSGLAAEMHKRKIHVAYFQKVYGKSVLGEVRKMNALGIRTIFGICDRVVDEMAEATDATIVVTEFLKHLYADHVVDKISVVHDGIEASDIYRDYDARPASGSAHSRLKLLLVTSSEIAELPVIKTPPSFVEVTIVGDYPTTPWLRRAKQAYWTSRSISRTADKARHFTRFLFPGFRAINWTSQAAYELLVRADVGIIPVDRIDDSAPGRVFSTWEVKSENRLTMKMSAALPVIASPVPSYLPIVDQGNNGYIASSRDEWIACLEELRNPDKRRYVGEQARASVIHRFSKDEQARKLIEVLDRLSG